MNKGETIALVSLGCAKNAVDLQVAAGNLVKAGCVFSKTPDRADTVIVNTCAFIESARQEAEAEIRRALMLKAQGNYKRVVVSGCYPQRYPKALAKFPGVDEWRGVPKDWVEPKMPGLRFTGKAFAYLKIAEGCSHRCSYCAIPMIRGKYRSRPIESILKEARALVKSGCRELNIVAQDPMLYGLEWRKSGGPDLVDLLWRLDKIKGDFWVRVLYSYPSEITEEFLIWMTTSKHAAKYIDVPLQHTDPDVLAKMNRKAAIDATRSAAEVLRAIVPGVTLRTTIMTGFPGETETRFKRMLADLARMQFDHVGVFAYSPEEGTKGAKMGGRPSRKTAEDRAEIVANQWYELRKVKSERMVGEVYRALVVAPGVARMESQAPDVDGVVFVPQEAPVGEFVNIRIVSAEVFDFTAELEAKSSSVNYDASLRI